VKRQTLCVIAPGRACGRSPAAGWTRAAAHCHVVSGHSIDDPEPKYGMAVAGELPGAPVIGELVPRRYSVLIIW
jgi:selenophosphate synthase